MKPPRIGAVLFDLDGTLVDTAPDLAAALNIQRTRHSLPPLALDTVRPYASHGTSGLLWIGFGLHHTDPRFAALRLEYLDLYEETGYRDSRLFDGMDVVLSAIEARGLKWGVVTNKPARFTEPLMAALELSRRAACMVSGDTVTRPKPAPDAMHVAASRVGLPEDACLYVGDAERDVEAASSAGMPVVVATWGYLGEADHPESWGASGVIDAPADILALL